ncbi:hypothetical protein [Dethiosulfatarculus sandiegensis]|uniref:hypothetical protein n=1 Tax=Dethiosulfatarculus sandiegensis TaxID=1429043 RepID=UPI0012E23125|nr:hypothetical protein [Dethiosulfatarculus sandiegensis]
MAQKLPLEDLEGRIDCFGEFDRSDTICLAHCSLSFHCSAAREHYQQLQLHDESLERLGFSHHA